VKYSPDGTLLMVVNNKGLYTIFDTERNYAVINQIEIDFPSIHQYMDFSKDGTLFAITGDNGNFIDVYNSATKSKITKIRCKNSFVTHFQFSNCGNELFVATTNQNLRRYAIVSGKCIRELPSVHLDGLTSFDLTSNSKFIITVGQDSLVKVWDYEMRLISIPGSCQLFVGHSNPIRKVLFGVDNHKVYTAGGSEGIFEWNFLGDVTSPAPKVPAFGMP